MKEIVLNAGDIIREEWSGNKQRKDYTEKERNALRKLADKFEAYFWHELPEEHFKSYKQSYVEEKQRYRYDLEELSDKEGRFPFPTFFMCKDNLFYYTNNLHYIVPFSDRDAFDIYHTYFLRYKSEHELADILNNFHSQYGEEFLSFYSIHLKKHGFLYSELHLSLVNNWLEEANKKRIEKIEKVEEKSSVSGNTTQSSEIVTRGKRQFTLMFYYYLKFYEVDIAKKGEKTRHIKFMHLLLNEDFKSLTNSSFNKLVSVVPSFGSSDNAIKHLTAVKQEFKKFKLDYIANLVDENIEMERNNKRMEEK